MISLDSWLYDGGDPLVHLQFDKTLNKLKSNMDTSYFENFIKERIINNPHSSLVIIEPKKRVRRRKTENYGRKIG